MQLESPTGALVPQATLFLHLGVRTLPLAPTAERRRDSLTSPSKSMKRTPTSQKTAAAPAQRLIGVPAVDAGFESMNTLMTAVNDAWAAYRQALRTISAPYGGTYTVKGGNKRGGEGGREGARGGARERASLGREGGGKQTKNHGLMICSCSHMDRLGGACRAWSLP